MKWGAQQGEQLMGITFQSWKEDIVEVKAERQMMKLGNEQDSVLIKNVFSAWKDDYYEGLEEKNAALLKGKMSAEKDAQMSKLMAKFAGDQESVLKARMFKAWVEFSSVLAEERAAEEMRANMSSEKDAQMQKL